MIFYDWKLFIFMHKSLVEQMFVKACAWQLAGLQSVLLKNVGIITRVHVLLSFFCIISLKECVLVHLYYKRNFIDLYEILAHILRSVLLLLFWIFLLEETESTDARKTEVFVSCSCREVL